MDDERNGSATRLGGDRQPPVGPELWGGEARSTPGDPALVRNEKDEIDRYVDWQHDRDMEYPHH